MAEQTMSDMSRKHCRATKATVQSAIELAEQNPTQKMLTVRPALDFRSHRKERLSKASVWRARACDPCGTGVDIHVA